MKQKSKIVGAYYNFFDKKLQNSTLIVAIIGLIIVIIGIIFSRGPKVAIEKQGKANILNHGEFVMINGESYYVSLEKQK